MENDKIIPKKEFLALPIEERRRLMRESVEKVAKCEACPDWKGCEWDTVKLIAQDTLSNHFVKQTEKVSQAQGIMPIVNPHNDETADRDAEKVLQRDADLAIYQKREAELLAELKEQQEAYQIELDAASVRRNALEIEINELKGWKQKEAEWLMANIFNKGLVDEPALATHIAALKRESEG